MASNDIIPFPPPTTDSKVIVGFAGLGGMGSKMARNLAKSLSERGYPPLRVYNRTRSKAEEMRDALGDNKIKVADSAAALALECDVVCGMLGSDAAVKSTYLEFNEALKTSNHTKPKIFVEMSTIFPTLVGELDQLISTHPNTRLITCPVFGPPINAENASLLLFMSGHYESKREVAYLLCPAIGRKVTDLGEDPEKAPTFKLIGNSMILGSIEMMSEIATMSEKTGIGAEVALGFVKDLFPAPLLVNYMKKLTNDEFDGAKGFAIDGGIKDASHIRQLAAQHNAPMPVIDVAYQHLLSARGTHLAQKAKGEAKFDTIDWSSLIAGNRIAAGMDAFQSGKSQ